MARTTSYVYDKIGRKIQTTLPDPDGAGRTDCPSHRNRLRHSGNIIQTRDANDNLWQYTYDAIGRQTAVTAPDLSVTTTVFDLVGNAIQTIDAKSLVTDRVFDSLNRLTSVVVLPLFSGGVRPVVQTGYDGVGNVSSIAQPTEAGNRRSKRQSIRSTESPNRHDVTRSRCFWSFGCAGDTIRL